jgi:predicted RNA binding protein YcfA (HicA-like mRNA interferase family)
MLSGALKAVAAPGRVTIAGHPSDDLAPGTFNSILKQAGLKG